MAISLFPISSEKKIDGMLCLIEAARQKYLSASEVAEIAAICWEAAGNDPADFELEHLPSFEVDVQRRWPSVEKAQRLLGWSAQIDVRDGIRATAEWLREQEGVETR